MRKRIASASRAAAAYASTCAFGMVATCSWREPWLKTLKASTPARTMIAAISARKMLRMILSARRIYFFFARSMPSTISFCASAASPHFNTFTHLPFSRSL